MHSLCNYRWKKSFIAFFLIGALTSMTMAACGIDNPSSEQKKDVQLTLVSFAVTKQAYKEIIPKFVEKWQKEHNQKVTFGQSYGGSGAQTRAVIDGLDADIVHLALEGDTSKIEQAGLINQGWEEKLPNQSIVSQSVPVLVVREGNPKNIQDYADLKKEGIRLITADPKTSGVAKWNFLAIWNALIKKSDNDTQLFNDLIKVYANVPILARDAREATDAFFKQRQGDVLINYENEIILASQKGQKVNYVIPPVNVSIDNPIAVVDKNIDKHGNREVAEAFVKYLFTPEAQTEFAKVGFRPVEATVAKEKQFVDLYPPVKDLATVKDLGGWDAINKKFFADGAAFDQIQAKMKR
ncbi:sulfate ABC transporter substrate-binding protein [Pseudanabaena mucicola]|uniref:Sulfate ABC transporter substrate-binding protein n=1 Tax=Pseudanabaena mucicola FACHB-723 TaxID=2692860 RepID=A0ABR7ZSZ6_9CYAN|nr:sulfate ABC transporter substrate-binding protein [Pseudanabaena mucicola FACHB-723]